MKEWRRGRWSGGGQQGTSDSSRDWGNRAIARPSPVESPVGV